jgi:hypothetical protein
MFDVNNLKVGNKLYQRTRTNTIDGGKFTSLADNTGGEYTKVSKAFKMNTPESSKISGDKSPTLAHNENDHTFTSDLKQFSTNSNQHRHKTKSPGNIFANHPTDKIDPAIDKAQLHDSSDIFPEEITDL